MVPAERMDVPAAWDEVEPSAAHNSCAQLETSAESNCLIMFLHGTGGPFSSDPVFRRCGWEVAVLDFTDVFASSMVFGRVVRLVSQKMSPGRIFLLASKRTFLLHEETFMVLIFDYEYFVSTARKGRAHHAGQLLRPLAPVLGCGGAARSRHSDLWSRATSESGRCGRGTSQCACLWAANLPTGWRPRVLKLTGIQSGPSRKLEAPLSLFTWPRLPEQVHPGVPRHSPSQAPCPG